MNGKVEFQDGTTLPISQVSNIVPSTAFQGEPHVQVCDQLLGQFQDRDSRHIFLNTLSKKSSRARAITALLFLARRTTNPLIRIESDVVEERFQPLFGDQVTLVFHGSPKSNALDRFEIVRFLGKALLHTIFRFAGVFFSKRQGPTVIRAWVDSTDRAYRDQIDHHPLVVFPFFGSHLRQLKYLIRLVRQRRPFRVAGVPYRIRDLLAVAFFWNRRDQTITAAELHGFERLATRLIGAGIETIYTTDEYEVASFVLHERLIQSGIQSINRSHGIATYGPCVTYSVFRCHTESQAKFYQMRGSVGRFEIKPFQLNSRPLRRPDDTNYSPVFLYLMGNWRLAGKKFEEQLELTTIESLLQVSKKTSIPLILKAHPNMGRSHRRDLESRFGISIIDQVDQPLETAHPIVMTLLSSAYYDYFHWGPVIICRNNDLDPTLVYGDDVVTYHVGSEEADLEKYMSPEHWNQQMQTQLERAERTADLAPSKK